VVACLNCGDFLVLGRKVNLLGENLSCVKTFVLLLIFRSKKAWRQLKILGVPLDML